MNNIEIFPKFRPKLRFFKINLTKSNISTIFSKFKNFRKILPKSRFSEILTKCEVYEKIFWPKSKVSKILSEVKIFQNHEKKSRFSQNFDQIWDFSKNLLQGKIFENLDWNRDFQKILTKIEIPYDLNKFRFSKNFTKNDFFN